MSSFDTCQKSKRFFTLGDFIAQDFPNGGYLLPEYPSTFNKDAKFQNKTLFPLHDNPPYAVEDIEMTTPVRLLPAMGRAVPIMMRHYPSCDLLNHWHKWLPKYEAPDIRLIDEEDCGEKPIMMKFPLESIPHEKHAVEPNTLYKLFGKQTLPEMGARTPKHYTKENYPIPCVMKVTYGNSGRGIFFVKSEEEAKAALKEMEEVYHCKEPVIMDIVENLVSTDCIHFYINRQGEVSYIGANRLLMENGRWTGGGVDWEEQDTLIGNLSETVSPIVKYLHNQGYYGFCGIDVLTDEKGIQYAVDVNPRVNGSTPLLLVAARMAECGYVKGEMITNYKFSFDDEYLFSSIDMLNKQYEGNASAVIMSVVNKSKDGKSAVAAGIAIFGKTSANIEQYTEEIDQLNLKANVNQTFIQPGVIEDAALLLSTLITSSVTACPTEHIPQAIETLSGDAVETLR